MKLVNVSKKGTLKFELSDGRFITSYNNGYVRINGKLGLYQINKVRKVKTTYSRKDIEFYYYERILIHCPKERYKYIQEWVKRNVKC